MTPSSNVRNAPYKKTKKTAVFAQLGMVFEPRDGAPRFSRGGAISLYDLTDPSQNSNT